MSIMKKTIFPVSPPEGYKDLGAAVHEGMILATKLKENLYVVFRPTKIKNCGQYMIIQEPLVDDYTLERGMHLKAKIKIVATVEVY